MKDVQAGTSLTESNLFRLSDHGGWTADRVRLPDAALDAAIAIIKHRIPAKKRPETGFWLNELFTQYVEDLRKRAKAWSAIEKRTVRSRRRRLPSETSTPKLTTTVDRELIEITCAIFEVERLIGGLASPGRVAIYAFFKRHGLVGRTRMNFGRGFPQTWKNACDAFLLIQVACERFEDRESEVSRTTHAELAAMSQGFDQLTGVIETLSDPTRKVLQCFYRDLRLSGDLPNQPGLETQDPVTNTMAWLFLLHSVAAYPRINKGKRGRDEAPARRLIRGLAKVYREMTGKEPGRVYRSIETRSGDPVGETGDFLKLVQELARQAKLLLPETTARSLSKIVREVLEERRSAQTA